MTNNRILIAMMALLMLSLGLEGVTKADNSSYVQGWSPYTNEITYDQTPKLEWLVGPNGHDITEIQFWLDGQAVPAQFDDQTSTISYEPTDNLALGRHSFRAIVSFSDGNTFAIEPESEFIVDQPLAVKMKVDPYAGRKRASLEQTEKKEIEVINRIRIAMGLPEMKRELALSQAAQAHSNYLEYNRTLTHYQEKEMKGFIGADPSDRAAFFGYTGGIAEDASSDPYPFSGVQSLIDAPYHRLPFMDASASLIGIGHSSDATVIDFGYGTDSGEGLVSLYPYPGQTGISSGWHDTEIPSPLSDFNKEGAYVGYPILMNIGGYGSFTVQEASIKDDYGREVPFYHVDAGDSVHYVLLIPKEPLKDGYSYTVSIQGTRLGENEIQQTIYRKWLFTTESYGTAASGALKTVKTAIIVDGKRLSQAVSPVQINGSTLVPLRDIFEALGVKVSWEAGTRTVTATKGAVQVTLQAGSYIAKVNGEEVLIDAAPRIYAGSTMIPARFAAQAFGAKVTWQPASNTIVIEAKD